MSAVFPPCTNLILPCAFISYVGIYTRYNYYYWWFRTHQLGECGPGDSGCFAYLRGDHLAGECIDQNGCNIIGFGGWHRWLILTASRKPRERTEITIKGDCTAINLRNDHFPLGITLFKLITADRKVISYALLGSGPDATFVRSDALARLGLRR